jgi:hypothetical protein
MNCIKPIVSHQVQLQEVDDILNFAGISLFSTFENSFGEAFTVFTSPMTIKIYYPKANLGEVDEKSL